MELSLFEEVGELARTMVPADLGTLRFRAHRRGVKVWFDTDQAPRNHFEAQLVPRRFVDGTDGAVLEIGFHAEHGDPRVNDEALSALTSAERHWRSELGAEAVAGVFLGHDDWRRVSELWDDPDPDDPDLAFAVAARLVDYVALLTPHVP